MTIELQLLGGFNATASGVPIEGLSAAGPGRLLSYLALHRHAPARRMYLAALFWPDGSDVRARRRLSHNLWVLQTALAKVSPNLIIAERDHVGLAPHADIWIDVEHFESQIDTFELHRRDGTAHLHVEMLADAITQTYQGDLLSDHYDDWIEPIRLRLREKYLLGLRHLVLLQKSRGEYGAALVSARQLVTQTPLAEQNHAELMRLYWLTGRPDEALGQFDVCQKILADELGVDPSPELVELKDRIVSQRRAVPQAVAPAVPTGANMAADDDILVGRSEQRRKLLETIDSAFASTGGIAIVEAQAGMGKTKLLANVAEAARWRGATVAWARASEQQRPEPYGALARGLESALGGLGREQILATLDDAVVDRAARVLPSLSRRSTPATINDAWTGEPDRWQVHDALAKVIAALGNVAPTAVIFDDFQWIDDETLEFIRFIAASLGTSQVAFILSYRGQEARNRSDLWAVLTEIESLQSMQRISLQGLSNTEISALAQAKATRPLSGETIDQLERATGGNPLFVIETIRALSAEPDASGDEVIAEELGGRATVDRVTEVLLREIDNASPQVRALVGALSVLGAPAPSNVLAQITHMDVRETLTAAHEGIAANFIAEVDGRYGLRFDQLAAAASQRLSDEDSRAYHHRAAELRAQDPLVPASELAAHCRAAQRWSDAARYEAAAAARAASLHSYETALHYYQAATTSLERTNELPSPGLLLGFESVLDTLGRRDDQDKVLVALEQQLPDLSTLNQIRVIERRALFLANTDELHQAIQTACAAVGFAVASEITPTPYIVSLARVLILAGYPDLARRHLEGLIDETGSASGVARAQMVLGQALTDTQDLVEAQRQLDSALRTFVAQNDPQGQVEALTAIAVLRSQCGDSTSALAHYREAIDLARQIGNRFGEGRALTNLALLHYIMGDAARALAVYEQAVETFATIGHRRGEAMIRANSAFVRYNVLGDDTRAEHDATLARRYFEEVGDQRHCAQCLGILGGIRRRKRAFAVSRKLLTAGLEMLDPVADPWLEVQLRRALAWTEFQAGNPEASLKILEPAVEVANEHSAIVELPALLGLKGLALLATDQPDAAAEAAHISAELADDASEMRHIAAWWRHQIFAAVGNTEAAQAELEEAHERMIELLAPFSEDVKNQALTRVAEHRQLSQEYAARFARTETVTLAPRDQPTRLAKVEVKWTPHHPEDLYLETKKERRQQRLLRLLGEAEIQGGHAKLDDLSQALDASISTLKRDLAELRKAGVLPDG